ncbi:MAG: OsmC family peroxiredoxin [Alphaproteobacteria bacterium]|nr:OsmC family peroxiredoxin [Alphaproteobacteria bacterium]
MATYTASLTWSRGDLAFEKGRYSRGHEIAFDGGVTMPASSSPHVVPVPLSREDAVDPEEMLVAALSSCHMLTFLDLARRAGFVIETYADDAEGALEKLEDGRMAITRVTLRPRIAWGGGRAPTQSELDDLHHKAHSLCFIANSFSGEVKVEGAH